MLNLKIRMSIAFVLQVATFTIVGKQFLKYISENDLIDEDTHKFNKSLKKYLINNPLYSLEELTNLTNYSTETG